MEGPDRWSEFMATKVDNLVGSNQFCTLLLKKSLLLTDKDVAKED